MKNLLRKFGFQRLIEVVIIAISSISMWGCTSCSDEKVIDRGVNVQKFAILNDSTLVLFVEYWDEVEFYSGYIQGQEEKTNIVDSKIVLVNPYKNVSIINLFKDERELLNVDTTSFDSCDYYTRWKEGNLKDFSIAISDVGLCKSSQQGTFFLYDLKQKIIRKWIPSGNSAWIAECNDIQWTENRFRCLDEKNGKIQISDEQGTILDSLAIKGCGLVECFEYSLRFYGKYIGVGKQIYKMSEAEKIVPEPLFEIDLDLWSNGGAYIHLSNGEVVSYTKEQLRKD